MASSSAFSTVVGDSTALYNSYAIYVNLGWFMLKYICGEIFYCWENILLYPVNNMYVYVCMYVCMLIYAIYGWIFKYILTHIVCEALNQPSTNHKAVNMLLRFYACTVLENTMLFSSGVFQFLIILFPNWLNFYFIPRLPVSARYL